MLTECATTRQKALRSNVCPYQEMPQLSEFYKGRIIGMLEAELSIREVARKMNCCKRTVEKWWKRFREEGHAERKPGSGRPRVTDAREDQRLVLGGKRHRFSSMRVIYKWHPGHPRFSLRTAYRTNDMWRVSLTQTSSTDSTIATSPTDTT